jgi:surface antigen
MRYVGGDLEKRRTTVRNVTPAIAAALALSLVPVPSPADPPPWAPAHGWRKKNDPTYVGYTGKKWGKDYGVLEGRCNTAQVGSVVGGVVGGAVGSQVGNGSSRTIAILVGTAVGAVIGAKIGQEIDAVDRACMGHALELTGERKTVVWTNRDVTYRMTPTRNYPDRANPCREFTTVATVGKKKHAREQAVTGVACRQPNGDWIIRT